MNTQILYLLYHQLSMPPKPLTPQQMGAIKQKRDTQLDQMRRNNRQQTFAKHRAQVSGGQNNNLEMKAQKKERITIIDKSYKQAIQVFLQNSYTLDQFGQLITSIISGDIIEQHYGMIGIGKLMLAAQTAPIQNVIDAGIIPKMIQYTKKTQYPQLQIQATFILAIISGGTVKQMQSIIDLEGITLFVDLLRSNNDQIVGNAIVAIGNISSDCIFYRDKIIQAKGLIHLAQVTQIFSDQKWVQHCCWALSSLCRGNPLPKYDNIKLAITVLCKAIAEDKIKDKQIISDSCWAISYHSDSNKGQIVIQSGVIPKIIKHLEEYSIGLLIPSLRILGNIASFSVEQGNFLLNAGLLLHLEKVLKHDRMTVRRQACWILSNLVAGTRKQVQSVLVQQSLIKKVLQLFENDRDQVKRQICYIFSNMSHNGEPKAIFNLYQSTNIIKFYIDMISSVNDKSKEVSLECLYIILAHGQKFKKNPLVMHIQSLGAVDTLQKLKYHKSDLICENHRKIKQAFFKPKDPEP